MSKKLQCQDCGQAEYGEDLYNYDGEILCRYCIVARVYEGSTPCEYVGTCNDKTFLNKVDQIDQLKQQLEIQSSVLKQTREKLSKAEHDRDRYRDKIKEQQEQLAKKENMHPLDEKEFQHYCAYKHIEPEIKGCLDRDREREYIKQLTEKQKTIDEINKEFVQAVHDWKALCAKKDEETEKLKQQYTILENENDKLTTDLIMDKYKKAQKEVSFGKQLAIQELSEVERLLYESHYKEIDNRYYAEYEDIKNLIDSRIQALEELKGEKDERI